MSAFDDVRSIVPRRVWNWIIARALHGERLTLALVELAPGAVAETHSHDHEQLGLVPRGRVRFQDGASVLDLFAPPRSEGEPGETGPGRGP